MQSDRRGPLWTPSRARVDHARMTDYRKWLRERKGMTFADYAGLWQWSVEHVADFYESVWEYFDLPLSAPWRQVLDGERMPGARWFEGARLNLAEQMFRQHRDEPHRAAIVSRSELRALEIMTWGELRARVASVAHALRELGVKPGDRVVAYLPNIPETIVAFYAVCSIGATWSVCSPDMGARSVLDRFRQIEPRIMIAADGYRYGGKDFSRLDVIAALRRDLPTLEHVVVLRYLDPRARLDRSIDWHEVASRDVPMRFEQVDASHPLWVVYSSGTTGLPKPIVHGHAGALVSGVKDVALHLDIGDDDRFMWFASTGWIMWNVSVTALLVGATVCLYDGSPGYPDMEVLWRFVEETRQTFFGAGAAYFLACRKAGIAPGKWMKAGSLKSVGSTGSPLSEEGYRWIMEQVPDCMIAAISGGTDVAAAYVGACPILPVYAGEMQCRYLGTAVYAFNEKGEAVEDEVGELVVTKPMPSMPLCFWNDTDGKRYHDSYFDVFPGVWRHGDWIRITPCGGAIIYGRSDTTINRHGIRMGTGEIYRVVNAFPDVEDSMVVDLEYLGHESYMPLFVKLRQGASLGDDLIRRIKAAIHDELSPRHVPDDVLAVPDIPRTLSGKKMELPVRKLLLGQPLEKVASLGAMANPESMAWYQTFAQQRGAAV